MMLTKLRDRLQHREDGAGELFTLMLTLPVIMFMLFIIINFSTYYQVRGEVQQAAQQGARLVALYGGNKPSQTLLNSTGKQVETLIRNQIVTGTSGSCTFSACDTAALNVNCTPDKVTVLGQVVSCTITYGYRPVAGSDPFGFTAATTQTFKVSASYVSETRYNE